MAGFNESQFRAWERGAPATRQAVSTAFQGVPIEPAAAPLPPNTPTLGSAMAQRIPRNTGGGAGGLLPDEVAERLYGRTAAQPVQMDMSRLQRIIPEQAPRFGADVGSRMAAATSPIRGMPAPPAPTGAMADLRSVGGSLGNALQKAGGVAGKVLSNPVVNNPLTRTAARFAGPAVMVAAGGAEALDQTSPTRQHVALAGQAYDEGRYGDMLKEGNLAVGNLVGAATGLRPLAQALFGPRQAAQPLAAAPTFPGAAQRQGAVLKDYLGPHEQTRFMTPEQAMAGGQPGRSALNSPMYYGDPVDQPLPLRLKLAPMAPKPHYPTAMDDIRRASYAEAQAQLAVDLQKAGNDMKARQAARTEYNRRLFALVAPGYAAEYARSMQAPED